MSSANNSINPGISTSPEVNKLALVVGVNTSSIAPPYRSTLKYAEKDAQDMASLLKEHECGFTLLMPALIGKNATSGNIKQRIIEPSIPTNREWGWQAEKKLG
ncbi:MAG TPA: hypothetical protein VHV10_11750 [Ktedonobacteraceae bacterium]|nr:hypothetical protein [Ktedonobacteraceae bacterium]